MSCQSCCGCCSKKNAKLCPVSLAVAIGFTAMVCLWTMVAWVTYGGASASAEMTPYMQHMIVWVSQVPAWQVSLCVFLKGAFVGFFIAIFYDLMCCICGKLCHRACNKTDCCCAKTGASCDTKKIV